ncbi:putative Cryptochrome-1 [Cocos nucifera]|nr:putative Cryptochrome-1 [Cocos nucifera]
MDAAKARLQEALAEVWQLEAATRAAIENGTEEGLGDSSELPPIGFPEEMQMEVDHEPFRNTTNSPAVGRRHEDQMVPSITSSIIRADEEEVSADLGNTARDNRPEVPSDVNYDAEVHREEIDRGGLQTVRDDVVQHFSPAGLQSPAQSTADSSSGRTERDGGVVPVWSPSAASSRSEHFVADDTGITSGGYLRRHPPSRQLINWRQLSQTL